MQLNLHANKSSNLQTPIATTPGPYQLIYAAPVVRRSIVDDSDNVKHAGWSHMMKDYKTWTWSNYMLFQYLYHNFKYATSKTWLLTF